MKNKKQEPWTDKNGKLKSTEQLKADCKDWSFDTWERYLMTLEVVTREEYYSTDYIDRNNIESFIEYISEAPNAKRRPLLNKAIKKAISSFSTMEFTAYKYLYLKNLTQTQTAKKMKIKRGSVTNYQKRIFFKVKKVLVEDKIMLPYEALKSNYIKNLDEN